MRKRVLVSCARADDDDAHVGPLRARARREDIAVQFIATQPGDTSDVQWEHRVRTCVRGSDGVVGLVSSTTAADVLQLWTIECAYSEKKPVLLIYVDAPSGDLPDRLPGRHINAWSWTNLKTFIESLWCQSIQR